MTIHEIEEKTGMTRANVRYYEKEGLLSPLRGSNNYRDYSENDLAALKKIQLLRQLRIPVAEIVRLQKGELSLDTVLASQRAALEQESRELSDAAQLCREMWNAHISYDSLNAEEWLNRSPAPEQKWKSDDVLYVAPHPWRRFLAQYIDYAIVCAALSIIRILVLRVPFNGEQGILERWLFETGCTLLQGGVETVLLCTVGTTPGKWIFGLRVRDMCGKKLAFPQSASRAFCRFVYGEACGVPLLVLWRYWVSYQTCANEEILPWDEEVSYSCTTHDWRHLLCIPVWLVSFGAAIFAAAQSFMPVNQGLLTKEEFIENCETFARQHMGYGGQYLDENLVWRENTGDIVIEFGAEDEYIQNIPYDLTFDADEHITSIHIGYTSQGSDWIGLSRFSDTKMIFEMGYAFAANERNALEFLLKGDPWKNLDWSKSFSVMDGCVRVTNEVEQQGYLYAEGADMLFRDDSLPDSQEPFYRWNLTLELTENITIK